MSFIINPYAFGSLPLVTYQPETTNYLTVIAVPNNSTIYYSGTAQQITGSAIWTALDAFVVSVKNAFSLSLGTNNLSSKFPAIYPMIGGTATSHKYNLCNPLDTNGAFRLTFSGGWTHQSTGILPNGSNAYADTFLTASANLSLNNTHISYYSRTNNTGASYVEMGTNIGSTNLFLVPQYLTASTYRAVHSAQIGPSNLVSNTAAMFIATRNTSTNMQLYRNNTLLANDVTSSVALNVLPIYIGCYNSSGTPLFYTNRECAFSSIGVGMSATEQGNFYNAVQQLQTSLFRQV